MKPRRLDALSAGALTLLVGYFLLAVSNVGSIDLRLSYIAIILIVLFFAVRWALRRFSGDGSTARQRHLRITVAAGVSLVMLVVADNVYQAFDNMRPPAVDVRSAGYRLADPNIWEPELHRPAIWYPTDESFMLHKPFSRVAGYVYGDMYYPELLQVPTVAEHVLTRRSVEYSIDENGFRESSPLEESRVFALGDSYTFGMSVNEYERWTDVVEQRLGQKIYNLSGGPSAPNQQLMTLRYALEQHGDRMTIEHVLWMIFEGNDLEDHLWDRAKRPFYRDPQPTIRTAIRGTHIDAFATLLFRTREQSLLNRSLRGNLRPRSAPQTDMQTDMQTDARVVDATRIDSPLYHSSEHGYRMFAYLTSATRDQAYVLGHRNRTRLGQVFEEMRTLADQRKFKVTIILAPQAARLYHRQFSIPEITDEPYFLLDAGEQARERGFGVIDLYPEMQSHAASELLYFRDDTHWNSRGNEVAGAIIARNISQ